MHATFRLKKVLFVRVYFLSGVEEEEEDEEE